MTIGMPQPPSPEVADQIRATLNGSGAVPVLQIGKKGRLRVQVGDLPVVEVDVIACTNAWTATDRQYRDEQGNVPPEQRGALARAAYDFVSALCGAQGPQDLTMAMALEFLAQMTMESMRLQRFFEVRSGDEPSSPGPTASISYESMDGPQGS